MKKTRKNAAILIICSFFLASCENNFFKSASGGKLFHIHDMVDDVVLSTCTEGGYIHHYCKNCDYNYTDNYTAPLGHAYVKHKAQEPTMISGGNKVYYTCKRCDCFFDEQKNTCTKEDVIYPSPSYDYLDSVDPVWIMHGNLEIIYTTAEYNNLMNSIQSCKTGMQNNTTTYANIDAMFDDLQYFFDHVGDDYRKAEIIANSTANPTDYALESEIYNAWMDSYNAYYLFMAALCRATNYRTHYFGDRGSSYFEQQAQLYEAYANTESSEAEKEMNSILNDYKAGKITRFNAISSYVKKANDYAESHGGSDYLSFAYQNIYGREYSVADTNQLGNYIANYIKPLYLQLTSRLQNFENRAYDNLDYEYARDEAVAISNNFFGGYLTSLYQYADYLGDDYLNNFVNFFDTGSYYFSNKYNNNITGYVSSFSDGTPYMFLGRDYQSVTTFIHEFGHYNAALTFGGLTSYDLAETQSQGNEMLYYSYLLDNCLEELTGEYFIMNEISSMVYTVIIGYAINELEKYVYTNENFTQSQLENKWIQIGNDLGFNFGDTRFINYMYDVLLNYQGYYISYAMSAIASLEIFAVGRNDYTKATKAYKSIYKKDSPSENFIDSLNNAGISYVFSADAYILISQIGSYI